MKNCTNCGAPMNDGAKFCEACGAPANQQAFYGNQFTAPGIAPGFSDRVNDPEILAAVKKNKNAAKIFSLILVPIPFIGFTIYSLVSDSMEPKQGMLYGAIISAVFLVFAVFGFIKQSATKSYEATVVEKKTRNRRDSNDDTYYTEYITVVNTTDGKKKKIVEKSSSMIIAYNYLHEGDRFRYHPQFNFPYELYDKSRAPYIACVSCGTHNDLSADRCKKCNIPLLK